MVSAYCEVKVSKSFFVFRRSMLRILMSSSRSSINLVCSMACSNISWIVSYCGKVPLIRATMSALIAAPISASNLSGAWRCCSRTLCSMAAPSLSTTPTSLISRSAASYSSPTRSSDSCVTTAATADRCMNAVSRGSCRSKSSDSLSRVFSVCPLTLTSFQTV